MSAERRSRNAAELRAAGLSQLGLRLDADLVERLRQEAEDRDVSVNWLVGKLLAEGLERLIPADEVQWTRG